jgi:hypothetical protein
MTKNYPPCLALAACLAVAGAAQAQATLRTGSGFAVSDATHIVTNAHVAEGCRSLRVLLGNRAEPARLLATDAQADLALLQANLAMPRLALRAAPAVRLGESVVAFGFPLAGSLSLEGNLTTGNVSALAGLRDDPVYLQVTAPVQPGNSGGPLLDEGGNVIGVITAKLDAVSIARRTGDIPQNVNFAVKAGVLEGFLQRKRGRVREADDGSAPRGGRHRGKRKGGVGARRVQRRRQRDGAGDRPGSADAATSGCTARHGDGSRPGRTARRHCRHLAPEDRAGGAHHRGRYALPDHLARAARADGCQ